MAEQGAAQGARQLQVEPNPRVVRCLQLEPQAGAVKLWAATMGIPVVDRNVPPSRPWT